MLWPLFLRLQHRRVLLVGGGAVAEQKARALALAGAEIVVVAPEIRHSLRHFEHHLRPVQQDDLTRAWLVVSAAPADVNRQVAQWAEPLQRFVLAVDDPLAGTAFGAAVLERGGVTVALSSSGHAPGLIALLRAAIEALLPDDLEAWVALAQSVRQAHKAARIPLGERVPLLLAELNRLYVERAT